MALTQIVPSRWLRASDPVVSGRPSQDRTLLAGSDDPFVRMHQTIDRLFDSVFEGAVGGYGVRPGSSFDVGDILTPRLDIAETDTDYVLSVDLPGIRLEDIALSANDDTLTIRAKRERNVESGSERRFHRIERSVGRYERTLSLPADADTDAIRAEFTNGVLEITVPRHGDVESPSGRRIEITTG
jgi:HSP20 family protein